MRGRRTWLFVLLAVALLLVVGPAEGSPGALDPSFGSAGAVLTTIASGSTAATALAVQPDGKILAGGETAVGSVEEFALARYNLDGSLDASFGSGGKVTTAIGAGSLANALVLQPNGKIIAAGGSSEDFAVARYNPDGSLDTSFGTGGKVTTPIPTAYGGEAYAAALQTDGKIVVGGSSGDNRDFVIARYNPNGSLDTSFGTGGIVTTATGYVRALALQPDGKIVAVGGYDPGFALARYNPDGSLDTSFGAGGIVTLDSTPGFQQANGVVLQPDGRIVIGGESAEHFALLRFSTDGTLDTNFGSVVSHVGSPPMVGQALVRQPDGKLVLAGYYGSTEHGFALARYNADGSPDAAFGVSGIVTTPLGVHGAAANAVALEPDGKILAGGVTEPGSNDTTGEQFALARYLVTSALTVTTDGDGSGVVTSNPPGIDCGATCTETFAQPTSVTLTATPAAGSTFTGWSGGGTCSGTTGVCQVEVANDQSVSATFTVKRSARVASCVVPRLHGKTVTAAKRALRAHFCSLGKIKHAFSRMRKGRVFSEKPAQGKHLRHGARVALVVSKGKRR